MATSHTLQELDEVGVNTQHHRLGLGIAHTAVVLDDVGVTTYVHQPSEDEATIVDPFGTQPFDGGADDTLLDTLHEGFVSEDHRRDRAHTTGIQARIALANALVVLGHREHAPVTAVRSDEDRALDTMEVLLDDDTRAGRSKAPREESTQLAFGFLEALADDDALTSRQTVSLQHVGRLEGLEVVDGLTKSRLIKGTVSRCGDTVALHERLAEVLTSLELSSLGIGPHNEKVRQTRFAMQIIDDPLDQGDLGPYDEELNMLPTDEGRDGCEVRHSDTRHTRTVE